MPSETDLYFPVNDAKYEAAFIPHCTLAIIPSLWGHPAGAGSIAGGQQILERACRELSCGHREELTFPRLLPAATGMFTYYFHLTLGSLRKNIALTTLMVVAIGVGIGASMTTLAVFRAMSGDPDTA